MRDILKDFGKKVVFFDGGLGTMLQEAGLGPGESPAAWNLSHPDVVRNVHLAYLKAGADIIASNTFGLNPCKQETKGSLERLTAAGISLAKEAVSLAGHGFVGLDLGPSGKLLQPLGDLEFEKAVSSFGEVVAAGAKAGADCIIIETMSDIYEAKAALLAAKEHSGLPVFVTMTFDETGRLLTGGDLSVMAAVLEGLGADAIGLNCGLGPEQMISLTKELKGLTSLPLIVMPNAGLPVEENGRTVYHVGPEEFAQTMAQIVQAGACAIGGCCGTTPKHLEKTVELCRSLPCLPPVSHERTVVASGTRAVEIGKRPVIIGERINPTGKARFKQALRENDLPYVLREGIVQQDAGAHILDVNVGLPEINEAEMMCSVVKELQSISPLPLQLDTADLETMARAMRLYNGKPLVNSVTAKRSSMEDLFPLVKKYGGVVIGLTITESGIPETARGRLEAARKIVQTAQKYGIAKRDIVIDPLTMAISADSSAALVTLEALRLIRQELGVCTSLGVSNISFGLPQREIITSAFFLAALQEGLNAAIMNPKSDVMMQAYRAFCALHGCDENCVEYISAYSQAPSSAAAPAASQEYSLREAIEKGLKEAAVQAVEKLCKTRSGLEIVNLDIVPALDDVGRKFESNTLFLPQLLMSADAAKAAFNVVRLHMGGQSTGKNSKLTVVIATVKGDVHDIGKNIVKVLLENYGFHVIDLGKDVSPEEILQATKKESASLVGLSALMTTTVPAMKDTIQLLHKEAPGCKIMVGGAVLTQEYADMIGADFYSSDAMSSVRYASSLAEQL